VSVAPIANPGPEPGTIAADARVIVLVADFANTDATGKMNVIGGGWQVVSRQPLAPGVAGLPGLCVVAIVELPPQHHNEQFAVSIALEDCDLGAPVRVPGPNGQLQALRIQQIATANAPMVPGVPAHRINSRVQVVIGIPPGLPVEPGHRYRWVLELDGHEKGDATFHVTPEQPPAVVG
jgi:hypothetical protein